MTMVDDTEQFIQSISDAIKDGAQSSRDVIKLQAFKDYVHKRLDDAGVPENPNPDKTAETGCRIGQRLDWLLGILHKGNQ